jgi:hypothetical protein
MNRLQVELDIESIERMCDHATSGNVAHVIGTIKSYCRMMKEELDVPDWSHYRAQAAIAALQGILSNNSLYLREGETFPNLAVRYADALIEELKKK